MEEKIAHIRDTYQIDMLVLTSYDAPTDQSLSFADDFFDYNGYGLGDDYSGFVYFIDMHNRNPVISTCGLMIDYISDSRLEKLLDAAYEPLPSGGYGDSALIVISMVEDILKKGIEEGHFRYDTATGKRLSGIYNKLTDAELGTSLIGGMATMGFVMLTVYRQYNLKGGTFKYKPEDNGGMNYTCNDAIHLRSSTRVVKDPPPSSSSGGGGSYGGGSSSGVRTSSSGRSHGGGVGRKF